MRNHLTTQEWIITFIILFVIQFTTHLKAVANGMVYNQIMNERNINMRKLLEKMKEDAEKKKDD